jgi:hypothetical protein
VEDTIIGPFLIPVVAIIGAFAYSIVHTLARSRVRELEIRERIAMIERGLVPAPEVDPRGFERAMGRLERHERLERRMFSGGSGARHRRAGVTLVGVGVGLMVLIAFSAGEAAVAIGVGGFLVVVGLAFFVNSFIDNASQPPMNPASFNEPRSWGAPPQGPPSPPEPPRPTNG